MPNPRECPDCGNRFPVISLATICSHRPQTQP